MANSSITAQNLWVQMLEKKHLLGFDYGFTIPFIVGAYYKRGFLTDEDLQTSNCIRFVLETILKSASNENPVKIFDCPELENELILQYLSTNVKDLEEIQHLKTYHPNVNNLIYWHKKESDISNLDSLVNYLWNKPSSRGGVTYDRLISNQYFSCHKGIWASFNTDEIKFIENQL